MGFLQIGFAFVLLPSVIYAGIFGGRTGRVGAMIVITTTVLTASGTAMGPNSVSTSYLMFAADGGCLLALAALAMTSNRFWPIWAMGFQTVVVATHIATIWIPDITPEAYQDVLSCWSIAIWGMMVAGTWKDRRYQKVVEMSKARPG